jgi:hypothetical protein
VSTLSSHTQGHCPALWAPRSLWLCSSGLPEPVPVFCAPIRTSSGYTLEHRPQTGSPFPGFQLQLRKPLSGSKNDKAHACSKVHQDCISVSVTSIPHLLPIKKNPTIPNLVHLPALLFYGASQKTVFFALLGWLPAVKPQVDIGAQKQGGKTGSSSCSLSNPCRDEGLQ